MKMRYITGIGALAVIAAALGTLSEAQTLQKVEEKVLAADLYNRAPDVLPGILPEMRTPEYWIGRMERPDEVILTPEQIRAMNEAYQAKIHSPEPFTGAVKERIPDLGPYNPGHWWPGFVVAYTDPATVTPRAAADTVRARVAQEIAYLKKRIFGSSLAVPYNEREIGRFIGDMALDRVPDEVTIRYAITVRPSRVRIAPTFPPQEVGLSQNGKTRWDMFNVCVLKIAQPVTVLHQSQTGEYVFVYSSEGCGWVRADDVAFGTPEAIARFSDPPRFAVATADRVMFYSDPSCTYASGWFGMGSRLPLADSNMPRAIKIPVRMTNGRLITETAWLAGDSDVSEGWLPYTRRAVVTTAFKLLDTPYDWTGGWYGRNHVSQYRDIFACFGFQLPYEGELLTYYGHSEKVALPAMGKKGQFRVMLEHEPFITIQSCGHHAQLLLGEYNGEPIVLDQHGYGYTDADGNELEIRRCNVGKVTNVTYFLKRPVTFLELK